MGPLLAALPAIASVAGGLFSGGAKGAQAGRTDQDLANAQIYRAAIEGELGRGALDLQQRRFALSAPGQQAGDVVRADLLRNVRDVSLGRPGAWGATGGARPSALGPASQLAAHLLAARQLAGLSQPQQFAQLRLPAPPQPTKAGFMEKLMGGLGMAGNLYGAIAPLWPKKTPAQPGDAFQPGPLNFNFVPR